MCRSTMEYLVYLCIFMLMSFDCLILWFLFHLVDRWILECRRRRASAARILKNKKNLSNFQLIQYGFRTRVARKGLFGGLLETIGVGIQEVCSFILGWTLRLVVFYPFVFASRFIKLVTKPLAGANKKAKMQTPGLTETS